jgi:hypothetical protein
MEEALQLDKWMVWQVGGYPPRKKYDSFKIAVAEAYRLADLHRGKSFVVLKIEAKIKVSKDAPLEKENDGTGKT